MRRITSKRETGVLRDPVDKTNLLSAGKILQAFGLHSNYIKIVKMRLIDSH